ncbi:MAG: hypothetical protein COX57_04670 [Alphaproteobacteria bacterium CG_4_10_14_0_2_um_filter_63_37]|nr:MAG: hypothetical protein AUJ55_13190 [Proteobacteria bacterium CG1_02_64_396]PJA25192.1 MAG: hypothetical protein COX57_04670 [Alphaproteobacteria bacterium CG_4_10_14_0_2_um_filter_63_37]
MKLGRWGVGIWLMVLVAALGPVAFQAEAAGKRVALVIGNNLYRSIAPLRNAVADADAVAQALARAGFQVMALHDLDRAAMLKAVGDFKAGVAPGDEALFYYSGHGVQMGGVNYLLPVDIVSDSADQVKNDALGLQQLLDEMRRQQARFALAIIDACRDNPFQGKGRSMGGGRGLAATTPPSGQMILFSAGAGQEALDRLSEQDTHPHGLFTRVLLDEIDKPGVEIHTLLSGLRNRVAALAEGVHRDQMPALFDQMQGDFYFHPLADEAGRLGPDLEFWNRIKNSDDPQGYRQYLDRFPTGAFASLARVKAAQGGGASATHSRGRSYMVGQVVFEMVPIPGGRFIMGSDRDFPYEPHPVELAPFQMMRTEVTQGLWAAVMGDNPSRFKGNNLPVENVDWRQVQTFVTRLNTLTGLSFQLPSEAQWEFAARAGSATTWYWGNDARQTGDYAWYQDNSDEATHPVGLKKPNPWGLYDMSGNVAEWCLDAYHERYQGGVFGDDAPSDGSPWLKDGFKDWKVVRGGSFSDKDSSGHPNAMTSAARGSAPPQFKRENRGFRLVLSGE